ncbi:MAG: hypothetical protein QOJ07_82 [Thermoleophilaceae bacterium]|nr:hypothetical protein [Thermoleophilaceae bacterium]
MAHLSRRRAPVVGACALVLLLVAMAGCGGSGGGSSGGGQSVSQTTRFPAAAGKTLAQLGKGLGPGPVLAQAVSILTPGGKDRFSFGLFDRARKQISSGDAAVYVAPAGGGEATGPYYASNQSLAVKPPFQSQTVKNDPDAARSIYVSHIPFKAAGSYEMMGVVKLDGRLVATDPVSVPVTDKAKDPVPEVGDKAPKIVTPTVASVGGDVKKIDTRVPPGTMHDVNFADALGKRPILLVFATPALCQSRVCGPVVDIAEQVKSTYKGDAAFIHMEIYNDNVLEKGFRPQVAAYGLPSEPWVFAISRDGRVAARLEGAFSEQELRTALQAAEAK